MRLLVRTGSGSDRIKKSSWELVKTQVCFIGRKRLADPVAIAHGSETFRSGQISTAIDSA